MGRQYIVRVRGPLSDEVREALDVPTEPSPHGHPRKALHIHGDFRAPETDEDSDGNPYFRVWIWEADSADAARAKVEEALSGLDVVAVGEADVRGGGDTIEGRNDAIYRRAIEHLVAEAISGSAAEQERIQRNKNGHEPNKQLLTAQLRGSFPDTVLRLKWYMRVSDREMTSELKIWNRDEFNAASRSIEPLREWIEGLLFTEIYGADP